MDYHDSNGRRHPGDARGYGFDDRSRYFDQPPNRNYQGPHNAPDVVEVFRQPSGASSSGFAPQGTRRAGRQDANLDDFDRALMADQSLFDNNQVPTARLSLPTRHARSNYSSSPFFDQAQTQGRRTNDGQSSTLSATRLPSSPPVGYPPSSPTYRIQQRTDGQRAYAVAPTPTRIISKPAPNVGKARADFGSRRRITNRSYTPSRMRRQDTPALSAPLHANQQIELQHAPQSAHGIQLISVEKMPDRFRSIFPPLFNAIQSRCYPTAFESDYNLVLSAPTGGGKTVILEMAICRLISTSNPDQFKIVYMAPTKSLCSERHRDWQAKLSNLNVQSAELTRDTDNAQLRNVQSANLIVTTPEKWDSMTRKWKDHAKLMKMVKLFLIDEVHILKDSRGATLEAVVSRMKSMGTNVRFVALSATVPNSEDIATWLGRDHASPGLPAVREIFGEEFRPVKLEKHVVGIQYRGSDFGFEKACENVLPAIIAKYSRNKPIMIFCFTKASCVNTAKLLSNLWAAKPPAGRLWAGPSQTLSVYDRDLQDTISSGVAFHHGGLDSADRQAIERGYLNGQVNVICCTSTLAVGVNLPCHFVIIKNTVTYQEFNVQEYSDLEIMQMMGRAGRPQFGSSAVAVIITKQEKYAKYEKLVSGHELLESCLHLNLIEHLNAEIGLGTVYNIPSAKNWLAGTFLYVRMRKNPTYYEIDDCAAQSHLEEKVAQICERDLGLLKELDLVSSDANQYLKTTAYGDAMTRYFVQYETMRTILGLEDQPKVSDLLSALVQADEYRDIRLRANEKKLYKTINRHNGIKFSIKVDIAMHAHKRSLMLQMELGGIDFPLDEEFAKHRHQYAQDKVRLFASAERLIRCIIACEAEKQDAVGLRRALELSRSLSARAWDTSPFQMKQLPQIGIAAIRKLAIAGITCIEDLGAAEPSRIETLLNKNPPFGSKIVASAQAFPRLRAGIKMTGKDLRHERLPIIKVMVDWSFMNSDPPALFQRRPIYVELVIERSDGYLVDYQKIPVTKSKHGSSVLLSAEMMNDRQFFNCYVMCSEIAGTLRHAELKPELPSTSFPRVRAHNQLIAGKSGQDHILAKPRNGTQGRERASQRSQDDEFDDDDLDDNDLMNADGAAQSTFTDVDDYGPAVDYVLPQPQEVWAPEKLANGKWACNHKCKDKQACKHLCCREGVDKAPKPPKNTFVPASSLTNSSRLKGSKCKAQPKLENRQSTLVPRAGKKGEIERLDLASPPESKALSKGYSKGFRDLESLHDSTTNGAPSPLMSSKKRASCSVTDGNFEALTGQGSSPKPYAEPSSEFGEEWDQDLPSFPVFLEETQPTHPLGDGNGAGAGSSQEWVRLPESVVPARNAVVDTRKETDLPQYDAEFSDTEQALVGLTDSISLQRKPDSELDSGSCQRPPELGLPDVSSDKLFLSSSGPIDVPQSSHKRKPDGATIERLGPARPDSKKARTDKAFNTPQDLPQQADQVPETPPPSIKAGLPKWAYELDPAFIAEYQDIVEFI